eukprot:COSAG03_NODE_2089_length_3142_cov_11.636543_1_plen_170_part_00
MYSEDCFVVGPAHTPKGGTHSSMTAPDGDSASGCAPASRPAELFASLHPTRVNNVRSAGSRSGTRSASHGVSATQHHRRRPAGCATGLPQPGATAASSPPQLQLQHTHCLSVLLSLAGLPGAGALYSSEHRTANRRGRCRSRAGCINADGTRLEVGTVQLRASATALCT